MAKQIQHSSGAGSSADSPSADTRAPTLAQPEIAELLGFSGDGYPVIIGGEQPEPMEVPTTIDLGDDDVGSAVLVTFVGGRRDQPIITGLVRPPRGSQEDRPSAAQAAARTSPLVLDDGPLTIEADDKTVTVSAEQELVLRCGKASLRLRRDGFVELRGVDVMSRAARVNWIKGGSVSLN